MNETNVTRVSRADAAPLVSAIIPTVGRPTLIRAVQSALSQSWSNMEVIVSIDGARDLVDGLDLPYDPRLHIIASGSHVGGQLTRGRGIAESSGQFVALLDDDDVWLPTKIENQMMIAMRRKNEGAQHVLIACRSEIVLPDGQVVRTNPRRLPSAGESIPHYLFERRQITPGETELCSSMLLFDRELADVVPLDVSLPNHDDWNWLLSVHLRTATRADFSPNSLLRYTQNPAGVSVSSSSTSSSSSDWFLDQRPNLTAREFGDAILCHSVPLAIRRGEWRAAGSLLGMSLRKGSPGLPALAFAFLFGIRAFLSSLGPSGNP